MNFRIAASLLVLAIHGSWADTAGTLPQQAKRKERRARRKEFHARQLAAQKEKLEPNHIEPTAAKREEQVEVEDHDPDVGILSFAEQGDDTNQQYHDETAHGRLLGTNEYAATSCKGSYACDHDDRTPNSFFAGSYSCLGDLSCNRAGRFGHFEASDFSCLRDGACFRAGMTSVGHAVIGSQSCMGVYSCNQTGYTGSVQIGDWSCIGKKACNTAGNWINSNVTIASDSCVGDYACDFYGLFYTFGYTPSNSLFGNVTIGEGSCKCDRCCSNLRAGSVIGDCQCNSLAENCGNQDKAVNKPQSACPSTPSNF